MRQDALPSLRVTKSHVATGKPNPGRHSIAAVQHGEDNSIAFAIASSDHLELVDWDLHLRSTLLFSDAFPNTAERNGLIQAVAVDNSTQRIVAVLEDHVAVWHKTAKETYKVHSTFSTGFDVRCVDFCGDTMVVGGPSIALYRLDESSGLAIWSRACSQEIAADVVQIRLSPCAQYVASATQHSNAVEVMHILQTKAVSRLERICSPWHPHQVRKAEWIQAGNSGSNSATLSTETIDGTVRIWKCFPDEPHYFVLWLTIRPEDSATAIANMWFTTDGVHRLFSVLDTGVLVLHAIQNLSSRTTTAGRYSTSNYSKLQLKRQQLSILKYPILVFREARMTILGRSKSAGLGLLRLDNALETGTATMQPWKHATLRHQQSIAIVLPAEDPSLVLTVAARGETILWQARKVQDRTAMMQAVAIYRPARDASPTRAALSANGQKAVLVTTESAVVLTLQGRKLVQTNFTLPSFPFVADILSLNFDNSEAGDLFLVAVDSSSSISVWRVDDHAAELVCQTPLATPASLAVVSPQVASSAARVAFVDGNDRICLGSLLLEHDKASYRDVSSLKPQLLDISLLCCSTTNYIACVGMSDGKLQLQIINTQSSLFTTGLEYSLMLDFEDAPRRISFANTPDGIPLLLVTFRSRFIIVSQRRLDYYQENSMWTVTASTDLRQCPFPIAGTSMTYGGSVLVAAENQVHLFSRNFTSLGLSGDADLFTNIHESNGVLPDYHPQFLVQCLLSGKGFLVNRVLRRLYRLCTMPEYHGASAQYKSIPLRDYMAEGQPTGAASTSTGTASEDIFIRAPMSPSEEQAILTAEEAEEMLRILEKQGVPRLSQSEITHLAVVITTHIQVDAQRRALDNNGMRFLLSLKSFAISHRARTPPPTRSPSPASEATGEKESARHRLPQMRWRDVLWAFHSESQEILVAACDEVCGKPMIWEDAKQFCLPLWLRSSESLVSQLESIARNEFTRDDARDPTSCSLYYFALRKKRLVQGLWRQATFHKERGVMMKFLLNDFDDPRWRSAAIKNAYALMSKHRFHYAAAFFLLGDSLKDCLGVCLRQLDDWQLAVMLARVYDGDDGPHLRSLLNDHIVPMAFARGYRRLASWAFWMLKRRDLAVRVIVTPFAELLAGLNNPNIKEIGTPGQEDPSLVLLYSELRDWSVQTIRGSWAILPIRETQFITHIAEAFCRMGCHPLALDLVCRWQFTSAKLQLLALSHREHAPAHKANGDASPHDSPMRPLAHHRRRSSMFQPKRRSTIIMDVPSVVPSRSVSPAPDVAPQPQVLDAAHREGLKKVLKEVKAPPPEFDMSSFGF